MYRMPIKLYALFKIYESDCVPASATFLVVNRKATHTLTMKCMKWFIVIAMITASLALDYHEMNMDCDEAQVAIKNIR